MNEITELGKILKELRLEKGLTMERLCKELNKIDHGENNFNKGKISKWENGKEEPRLSSLKILTSYFGISIDNLYVKLEDKSKMINIFNQLDDARQTKVIDYAQEELIKQNNIIEIQSYLDNLEEEKSEYLIEVQSWRPSAGTGQLNFDMNETVTKKVKIAPPLNYDNAWIVSGDSMEPLYQDGDIIYTKKIDQPQQGQLLVIFIDNELFLKKVFKEKNCIRLTSLNKKYEDIIADGKNSINIVGRVVM